MASQGLVPRACFECGREFDDSSGSYPEFAPRICSRCVNPSGRVWTCAKCHVAHRLRCHRETLDDIIVYS